MIKGRGPKDMVWDGVTGEKLPSDFDLPPDTPQTWVCANCRSEEDIGAITLIGKIPLCEECCGKKGGPIVPAGGVEEIVERILRQARANVSESRGGRKPRAKRRSKEKQFRN